MAENGPTGGLNSLPTKLKTSMQALEDLAKEYDEQEQLNYDVLATDTGYFDLPVEYTCEVSVGAIKGMHCGLKTRNVKKET